MECAKLKYFHKYLIKSQNGMGTHHRTRRRGPSEFILAALDQFVVAARIWRKHYRRRAAGRFRFKPIAIQCAVLRNGIVIIIVYARRRRRWQSAQRVRSLHIAHPAQHRARSSNPIAGTSTIQDDRRWMMSSVGRSVAWSEPNMHACACPGGHKSLLHHPCSHPCVVGIRCIFCAAPTSSPPQHRFEAGTTATVAAVVCSCSSSSSSIS